VGVQRTSHYVRARAAGQVRVIQIPCERTARNYTHVCRTSGQRLRAASNARRDKRVSRVTRKVLAGRRRPRARVIDPRCNRQASDIARLAGNTRKLHHDPLTYIACTNGPSSARKVYVYCVRTQCTRVCTILRHGGRAIIRPNYTGGHNRSLDIIKRDYGDRRSVRARVDLSRVASRNARSTTIDPF